MVDALHETHRVVRKGGIVVDARPDSRVLARVERVGRSLGTIGTRRETAGDDVLSDRALATVKRERLFTSLRAGRFWHHIRFADRAELEGYLHDHLRLAHQVRWTTRPDTAEPLEIVRAVRYELLRRV